MVLLIKTGQMIGVMAVNKEAVDHLQTKKTPQKSPFAKTCQKTVPITNFFKPPAQKQELRPKDLFGYFKKLEKSPANEGAKIQQVPQGTVGVVNNSASPSVITDEFQKSDKEDIKAFAKQRVTAKTRLPKRTLEYSGSKEVKIIEPICESESDFEQPRSFQHRKSPVGCEGDPIATALSAKSSNVLTPAYQKKRKIDQSLESSADDFEDVTPASKKLKRKRGKPKVNAEVGDTNKVRSKETEKWKPVQASDSAVIADSVKPALPEEENLAGVNLKTEIELSVGVDEDGAKVDTEAAAEECVEDLEVISYEQFLELETSVTENAEGVTDDKREAQERTEQVKKSPDTECSEDKLRDEKEDSNPKVEPIPCGKTITTEVMIHGPPSPAPSDRTSKSGSTNSSPESRHWRRKSNVVVDLTEVDLTVTEEGGRGSDKKGANSQGPQKYHSFFTKHKPTSSTKQSCDKSKEESNQQRQTSSESKERKSRGRKIGESNVEVKNEEGDNDATSGKNEGESRERNTRPTETEDLATPKRRSTRKAAARTMDKLTGGSQQLADAKDENREIPKRGRRRKRTTSESEVESVQDVGSSRKRKASARGNTPRKKMALQKIFNKTKKRKKASGSIESDSDFEKCQTPLTVNARLKRQAKKKLYKSTVVDTGPGKNSPIRLRLTRLNKSLSDESPESESKSRRLATKAVKSNVKASKAQELLQKARTSQLKKTSAKTQRKGSQLKIIRTKAKRAPTPSSRKRLSRNTPRRSKKQQQAVTEVIEIGDSPENARPAQKKGAQSINAVLGKKPVKQNLSGRHQAAWSNNASKCKTASDKEDTPKGPVKLASIFTNFGKKTTAESVKASTTAAKPLPPPPPQISIIDESSRESSQDDDGFIARRDRLLNKMAAESVKKVSAKKLDPAPWPTVSHVQQKEPSSCSFWCLSGPAVALSLRKDHETKMDATTPADLKLGTSTLALEKFGFHSALNRVSKRSEFSYSVRKCLLQEISRANPNFPVNRWFKRYLAKRRGTSVDNKLQGNEDGKRNGEDMKNKSKEESGRSRKRKSDASDGSNRSKNSRRNSQGEEKSVRRSSRRLKSKTSEETAADKEKSQEKDCEEMKEGKEVKTDSDKSKDILWTDKYQPTQSSEIIGNKETVKKFHSWLSEWKRRSDREKKKLKEQLKKEAKKLNKSDDKSDEWWYDDDSDFDVSDENDSDYLDEDEDESICNTVLIRGPTGVGKTATVYACAQELGFKVFEVNASSKRSGKQILSELKEATQSHQVSHGQGSGTLAKFLSPGVSLPAKETKKPQVHSAFASFLKKPGGGVDKGGKKPKKKMNEHEKKIEAKLETAQPSSNLRMKIASTSLILFEEVDLIFEEDKGFWAAINTLMSTTKRPIVMTTSDQTFIAPFEGSYFFEHTFKLLPVPMVVTNLQLVCLAEDIRTDAGDIERLVKLYNCDFRRCLHSLQFWTESGADRKFFELEPLVDVSSCFVPNSKDVECKQKQTAVSYDEGRSSESVPDIAEPMNSNALETTDVVDLENEDEDFETQFLNKLIDLEIKTIVISEFYQSKGMAEQRDKKLGQESEAEAMGSQETTDSQDIVSSQEETIGVSMETESVELPKVDCLSMESSLGLLNLAWKKGGLLQHLQDTSGSRSRRVAMVATMKDHKKDVLWSNLSSFVTRQSCLETTDNKTSDVKMLDDKNSGILQDSLQSWSEHLDNLSSSDLLGLPKNDVGSHGDHGWWTATQSDGLSDQLTKCLDCDWSSDETTRDIQSYLRVASADKFRSQQCRVLQRVRDCHSRGNFDPAKFKNCNVSDFQEIYDVLQLVGKCDDELRLDVWTNKQIGQSEQCKDSNANVCSALPLSVQCNHRAVTTDYLPAMRTICKAERHREVTNAKRRFLHYLKQISMTLQPSTLDVLAEAFIPTDSTCE